MADGTEGGQRSSGVDVPSLHLIKLAKDGKVSDVSSAAASALSKAGKEHIVGQFFVDNWVVEEDKSKVQSALTETMHFPGAHGGRRALKAALSLPAGPWSTILFVAVTRSDEGALDGVVIAVQDYDEVASLFPSRKPASSDSHQAELTKLRQEADKARQEVEKLKSEAREEAEKFKKEAENTPQDVSELKAELEKLRKQLEQAAAQSASAAPKSNGLMTGEIQAKVMHDLRSPLTGIIGLANMLSEDDTPMKKPLKMIGSSASRALENVTKVMDFFNLSADLTAGAPVQKRAYDIGVCAKEVVETCQQSLDRRGESIQKKDVEFIKEFDSPLLKFNWDEYIIKQMIFHLISNAFKFTLKGHVKLKIKNDAQGQGVHMVVEDTGIGIAKGNTARVFDAFQQEDNSQSRRYEGLGIGLAIVQCVVMKCCGTVTLDSKPGQGSTFNIFLPCKPTKAAAASTSEAAPAASAAASAKASAASSSASAPAAAPQPAAASSPDAAPRAAAPEKVSSSTQTTAPPASKASSSTTPPVTEGALQEQNARLAAELSSVSAERDALTQMVAAANAKSPPAAQGVKTAAVPRLLADQMARGQEEALLPAIRGGLASVLPEMPPAPAEETPICNSKRTVLCVDDDPIHQETMRQTLEPCGYKLVLCMSGVECLKYMELGTVPDMILLDLGMPGINGFDVLQVQRKNYGADVLPIVMVSADERVSCVARGLELGANDWIRKPFEKTELVARVQAHLRMKDKCAWYGAKLEKVQKVKCYVTIIEGLLREMSR